MTIARRLLPLLWALLTVGVVVAVVWVGLRRLGQTDLTSARPADPPPSTRPASAKAGHDYYVLVKLVEFTPRKPNGGPWDRGGGSAPDAKVILYWHGNKIFDLPQREDELISTWDVFRVSLTQVALNGGNVDIASSINAPIVRVEPGDTLGIKVYDADVTFDDLALDTDLRLDQLHEGENDIPPPDGCGLRRLEVQLIDRQTSLSDLVAIAGKR